MIAMPGTQVNTRAKMLSKERLEEKKEGKMKIEIILFPFAWSLIYSVERVGFCKEDWQKEEN